MSASNQRDISTIKLQCAYSLNFNLVAEVQCVFDLVGSTFELEFGYTL